MSSTKLKEKDRGLPAVPGTVGNSVVEEGSPVGTVESGTVVAEATVVAIWFVRPGGPVGPGLVVVAIGGTVAGVNVQVRLSTGGM